MIPRDHDDEIPGVRPGIIARGRAELRIVRPDYQYGSRSRVWREANRVHLAIAGEPSRFVEITAETDVQERRLARIAVETLGVLPHAERVALFEAMRAGRVQP